MFYFKKNSSELLTRISDQKKVFGGKKNSTIWKSRNKSIDICLLFFLKDSKYDYEIIIPSPSVRLVRVQREELARPLAAVVLILLLLSLTFLQFENLGFCSLRLVLSNGDMHFEKKKKNMIYILCEKWLWTFNSIWTERGLHEKCVTRACWLVFGGRFPIEYREICVYKQRWIGRLPAPRKKVRRVSARSALLPSRGQLRNHAHIFLIGRWNVRMERGGGSGRRRLGGLVHVHWRCVYSSGPTHTRAIRIFWFKTT